MITGRRCVLGLLIVLGLTRAVSYGIYAAAYLRSPLEAYFLEAKMVLLAYRAEHGLSLYPDYQAYPHLTNFYGPIYFALVGLIGRVVAADIPGLFAIGRWISFGAGLATTLIVGTITARRYGGGPGLAGALLSLTTGSMIGFSVMTRPDLLAELLGVTGFFLAIGPTALSRVLGGLMLVLAMLTKQTCAVFAAAAVLAWLVDGNWQRGLRFGLGVGVAVIGVVGVATLLIEPNLARSLLGDSQTPWSQHAWNLTSSRFITSSPDALFFPVLGLLLWGAGWTGRRESRLAVLAAILVVTSVVTSAKRGSDLNYCLSLRVVECLAIGALWRAWALASNRVVAAGLGIASLLGCLVVVPGLLATYQAARGSLMLNRLLESSYGRGLLQFNHDLEAMAADPKSRILTDSGMIELYHKERAAFGDPFLFRIMVETGQIQPTLMRDRVDAGYYDLVVTTSEIDKPSYDTYEFGLPAVLVERVRARYVNVETRGSLFLYRRRAEVLPPGGSIPP